MSSSTSSGLTTLHLIYYSYKTELMGLFSTHPNHLNLFSTIFSIIDASSTPSLLSSLTTYQTQHPSHLYYILFIVVLVIYCSTFCLVQYRRYYNCPIKFSFCLSGTFVPHKTLGSSSISTTQLKFDGLHLHPFLHCFVLWTKMFKDVTYGKT